MANLLNPELRQKLKKEYRFRIIGVTALLIAISILSASILLLPAYLDARSDLKSLEYKIASLKGVESNIVDPATQAKAAQLNARITFINSQTDLALLQQIKYAAFLDILLNTVSYSRINFSENEAGKSTAVVSGTADSRGSLANLSTNLENYDWVETVQLPISSLAQSENIPFTITATFDANLIPQVMEMVEYLNLDRSAAAQSESDNNSVDSNATIDPTMGPMGNPGAGPVN